MEFENVLSSNFERLFIIIIIIIICESNSVFSESLNKMSNQEVKKIKRKEK